MSHEMPQLMNIRLLNTILIYMKYITIKSIFNNYSVYTINFNINNYYSQNDVLQYSKLIIYNELYIIPK